MDLLYLRPIYIALQRITDYASVDINAHELAKILLDHIECIENNPEEFHITNCNLMALIGHILAGHVKSHPNDDKIKTALDAMSSYFLDAVLNDDIEKNLNSDIIAIEILFLLNSNNETIIMRYKGIFEHLFELLESCTTWNKFIKICINGDKKLKYLQEARLSEDNRKIIGNSVRICDLNAAWHQASDIYCHLGRLHFIFELICQQIPSLIEIPKIVIQRVSKATAAMSIDVSSTQMIKRMTRILVHIFIQLKMMYMSCKRW